MSRTEINQANAQHSTGPRTEAGKQRSSLNALRHGLTGQIVVMPTEDMEAYQRHVQSFVNEYSPQGATESQLVQALADAAWRLNRVSVLETNLLTHDIVYEDFPNHESTHEMREAIAIAHALDSHTKALANLSLHGQRLSRQFERTLALLQKLQSTRLANQKAASPLQTRRLPLNGFVFPNDKIQVSARSRKALPVKAGADQRASQADATSRRPPDHPSHPVDVN